MITLAKHIETLLLDNDCVVVPNFGGFIAHYQSAHYDETTNIFFPPQRIIGFNPKLTMNDGLLVQSYMQAFETDFSDANLRIENEVEELKDKLFNDGSVYLVNIGTITCNSDSSLIFVPSDKKIETPNLYGLVNFHCSRITYKKESQIKTKQIEKEKSYSQNRTKGNHSFGLSFVGSALGIAVALILFFFMSVPVENSYVDNGNYAYLGDAGLFSSIKSKSFASTVIELPSSYKAPCTVASKKEVAPTVESKSEVMPATLPSEKVESKVEKPIAPTTDVEDKAEIEVKDEHPAVKEEAPKLVEKIAIKENIIKPLSTKKYHIIVSSVTSQSDALQIINQLRREGYNDASYLQGNGRYRISLYNFKEESSAYNKINQLKVNKTFIDAWVLSSK